MSWSGAAASKCGSTAACKAVAARSASLHIVPDAGAPVGTKFLIGARSVARSEGQDLAANNNTDSTGFSKP